MLINKSRLNIHVIHLASLSAISQRTKITIDPYWVSLLYTSRIVGRDGLCAQMAGWVSPSESGIVMGDH